MYQKMKMSMKVTLFQISEIGKGRLTVGKIYGGLLILENWKATKFGKVVPMDGQVKITVRACNV